MFTVQFQRHQGLFILQCGEQHIILDTGAPVSFGEAPLRLGDEVHSIPNDYLGVNAQSVSESIHYPIQGMLGADLLAHFDFVIDTTTNDLCFYEAESLDISHKITTRELLNCPFVIDVDVGERRYACFVDTGASICYLPADATSSSDPTGSYHDFNPLFGEFDTDTFDLTLNIAGNTFAATVGNLPSLAAQLLKLGDIDGIVGADFFDEYKVAFSPARALMGIIP